MLFLTFFPLKINHYYKEAQLDYTYLSVLTASMPNIQTNKKKT